MIKNSSAVRRRSFLLPVFIFADNLRLKKTKITRDIQIDSARICLDPRVKNICADIVAFKGSGCCFDWVLADLSLHYWDDATTRMIIAEIYKALVPGGCFSIACKSVADFEYGQGRKIAADTFEHGHIRHFFSLDYMRELLREFEIEKTAETERREKYYGHYQTVEAVAFKTK